MPPTTCAHCSTKVDVPPHQNLYWRCGVCRRINGRPAYARGCVSACLRCGWCYFYGSRLTHAAATVLLATIVLGGLCWALPTARFRRPRATIDLRGATTERRLISAARRRVVALGPPPRPVVAPGPPPRRGDPRRGLRRGSGAALSQRAHTATRTGVARLRAPAALRGLVRGAGAVRGAASSRSGRFCERQSYEAASRYSSQVRVRRRVLLRRGAERAGRRAAQEPRGLGPRAPRAAPRGRARGPLGGAAALVRRLRGPRRPSAGAGERQTFQNAGDNLKPPRTHHCSTCSACVVRMDHHCGFLHNCVGAANHGAFLRLLVAARRRRPVIRVRRRDGRS